MQACVIEVEGQLHELVNPRIVRATGDDRDLEGCLSIPGYVAYVTRRERVWVVAQNRHGQKIKVAGSGLLGRALQHELDHLDGKLYIDYLESMDELMAVGEGNEDDAEVREAHERPGVSDGRAGGSRVRTVFLGSGGFGVESLWRLDGHDDVELVGVVTAPPRPAGRKQRLTTHRHRRSRLGARRPDDPPTRAPARPGLDRRGPGAPPAAPRPRRLRADRPAGPARPRSTAR